MSLPSVLEDKISEVKTAKYGGIAERYGITIGIHNGARKGKSLTATFLTTYYGTHLKDINGALSNIVFKNLDVLGLPDDWFKPLDEIKKIGQDDYKNFIIVTDEFRSIIDSRMSASFKNLFISNILRDTGKFKQIHILTDQDANAVERRVRNNADIVLHPEIRHKEDRVYVKIFENYDQYYRVKGYDMIDEWDIEFSFKASDYYKFYDTGQKIPEYFLTFTPDELFEDFKQWLTDENIIQHKSFKVTKSLLTYWHEATGVMISDAQKVALMEYMKYKTDLPMKR